MRRWGNGGVGRRAAVGRRGAEAASGSALARGVRPVLEFGKGAMTELDGALRADGLRKEHGRGERTARAVED